MSSSSNEEISNVVDSDGDDDEDPEIGKKQRGRRRGYGFGKAKEMVQHQFTKAKRQVRRIRSRALLRSSSSSGNASVKGSGKMIIRDDDTRNGTETTCKFCFSRPRVLESPNESPMSDPNNPNFTFAMLKTLIEQNDFYCRECNPHVD